MPCLHPNSLIKGCRFYEGPGPAGVVQSENETLLKNSFFQTAGSEETALASSLVDCRESFSVSSAAVCREPALCRPLLSACSLLLTPPTHHPPTHPQTHRTQAAPTLRYTSLTLGIISEKSVVLLFLDCYFKNSSFLMLTHRNP